MLDLKMILIDFALPIILGVFGLISSWIAIKYKDKSQVLENENEALKEANKEPRFDVSLPFSQMQDFLNDIEYLKNNTKIDRFLFFLAQNGKNKPMRFTTNVLEFHKNNPYISLSRGARDKWVMFDLPQDYKDFLSGLKDDPVVFYEVKMMNFKTLRVIYDSENIQHASAIFLKRQTILNERDTIFYGSLSTHDEDAYTDKEKGLIKQMRSKWVSFDWHIYKL